MRKFFVLLLSVLLISIQPKAAEVKFAFSEIPDSLLLNAKAVIRNYSIDFEIKDLSHTTESITKAITIIDRSADEHALGVFSYSKEIEISDIEARFYDKNGLQFKKIGRSDFKDMSYDTYGTLFSDSRYLAYKPLAANYPYTVEYIVKYKFKNSYSYPSWYPLYKPDISIQYSSLNVIFPVGYNLRVKEVNIPHSSIENISDKKSKLFWEVKNLKAEEYEVFSPVNSTNMPYILLGPSEFKYDSYSGKMDSWNNFGRFFTLLNEGKTRFNSETNIKIRSIVKNCSNDLEKAKVLYSNLQNRTRYVNISIGIGGIQTFPAQTVEEYGYGDCKGLSNLMKAMLEAVGIKSFHAYVKAGTNRYFFINDFISHQFNHNILCVPIANDTIWLECTSQTQPFGYLGDFTDNRYALVITDEGGKLLKTKEYSHDMNQVCRGGSVVLNTDGSASAKILTCYKGLEYSDILDQIHSDYKTQKDYLYNHQLVIPDFKIDSFSYKDYPDIDPIGEEYLKLNLINYASISGNRMFVTLNLMDRSGYIPPKDDDRKNPIAIYSDYIHTDSIYYKLPDGYKIEFIPGNSSIESDFASVRYSYKVDSDQVLYVRKYEIFKKEHPKEKYNDLVSFYKSLKKADNQKLVLVKEN